MRLRSHTYKGCNTKVAHIIPYYTCDLQKVVHYQGLVGTIFELHIALVYCQHYLTSNSCKQLQPN